MFGSLQFSSAAVAAPVNGVPFSTSGRPEFDDVALGCECADPSLQIDAWTRENVELLQASLPA